MTKAVLRAGAGQPSTPESSPWIALDAMGSDRGPAEMVAGAVEGVRKHQVRTMLVGDEAILGAEVTRQGQQHLLDEWLRIHHAPDVVTMEDKPSQAVRTKKQSSMRVACDLCRAGVAAGVVSPGNSGVFMGMALQVFGRLRGVLRPAIGALMPTGDPSNYTVMLDSGANTVFAPGHLVQWAFLGDAYARTVQHKPKPRVAVLANGEEDAKGTDATRAANEALKTARHLINYVGYCEGRDIPSGEVDVVVTDGFTGNVALKVVEGVGRQVKGALETRFRRNLLSKLQYLVVHNIFRELQRRTDHRLSGGAPLLGINGVAIVSHGGSDALAIGHALRVARLHIQEELNGALARAVAQHDSLFPDAKKMSMAYSRVMDRSEEATAS